MRVAVIGAGGVGGYYGGMLARSGVDVTFIARGTQLEAIRSNGLTVKTTHVGEFTVPVQATSDPNAVGPVELVLVCVKTYDTDTAVQMLTPLNPCRYHRYVAPKRRRERGANRASSRK
jgi:2-dehydropantoate 2-reductase